jgi:hypothetical protein
VHTLLGRALNRVLVPDIYAARQPSIGDVISEAHYIAERHPIIANA